MQVIIDSKPYRLRELGSGLAQFIIVIGNLAIHQPELLLIDEPEINLHPSLQADFLTSLGSYTKTGVIFASHSIGLARTIADRIYSFQKSGDAVIVRPFDQTPHYAEFAGEMSFAAFKELGFETILLVEGPTDVKAVQQFLRIWGKDHEIVVLPLGGASMINGRFVQELAELSRVSNHISVLIDSERTREAEPLSKERAEFQTECNKLGWKVHVMERRAFENYLSQNAIQAIKGPSYKALQPYERLKESKTPWAKSENWRIAREMSKADILATDIGQFIETLK